MDLLFNFLFSIMEQFDGDGYKVLLVVYFILMYKYWKVLIQEKILILINVFILYGFILILFCDFRHAAFDTMLEYVFGWSLPFFLGYTVYNKQHINKFVLVFLSVFAILTFIGLFSYFGYIPKKILGMRLSLGNELRVGTYYRVLFAAKSTLCFVLSVTFLLFQNNITKKYKILLIIFMLLFFIGVLLSGSRIYLTVLALMIVIIMSFFVYKTKRIRPAVVLAVSLISIIFVFVFCSKLSISKRIEVSYISKDISISTRISMYKYSIALFKKYPLFGTGPRQATLREEFNKLKIDINCKPGVHLHSIYFNTLSNFGIVGLFLVLSVIFLILKKLVILYKKNNSVLVLAMIFAWICIVLGDIFDTLLGINFFASIYFWLTGLALSSNGMCNLHKNINH